MKSPYKGYQKKKPLRQTIKALKIKDFKKKTPLPKGKKMNTSTSIHKQEPKAEPKQEAKAEPKREEKAPARAEIPSHDPEKKQDNRQEVQREVEQKAQETRTDKAEPTKPAAQKAQETKTYPVYPKPAPSEAEPRQIRAQERVKLEVGQPYSPLTPEAAVAALNPGESKPPSSEGRDAKVLRILKTSLGRLTGRGMPELDDEVAQLIGELEGKK